MGTLISRFRKSKTTIEVLEEIDKDISHLEKFRKANQELRQKVIGKLILYSVVLYITGAVALYFFFMPQDWTYKIYGLLPFLFFPFLVYLLKRFLHWFFVRKISQNEEELQGLRDQRKDILENVMETETYKKAKEILEKFDPETKRKLEEERKSAEERQQITATPQPGLRRRQVPSPPVHPGSPGSHLGRGRGMPVPLRPQPIPGAVQALSPMNGQQTIPVSPITMLPRPILPLDKTPLDKLMDYMIGDGAAQRYALICRQCANHNGMALKEEFQYLAFRCAYCRYFNPARKQRPNAPMLPVSTVRRDIMQSGDKKDTPSASSDSENDTNSPGTSQSEVEPEAADNTVTDENAALLTEEQHDEETPNGDSTDAEMDVEVNEENTDEVVKDEGLDVEIKEENTESTAST